MSAHIPLNRWVVPGLLAALLTMSIAISKVAGNVCMAPVAPTHDMRR